MEVEELYLDLLALRELYILLLKSCLRDANSQLLDERAQILLKHLLDDATAQLLQFHSKTKPLEEKVDEWMEHNQSTRKMGIVAANDLPNGIGLALRIIEFQILSLQRCTSQSRNTRSHINGDKLANSPLNQQKLQSRTEHSILKARVTEPINGRSEFVHGFRVPLSQDNVEAMKPPTVETQVFKQKKVINPVILIDKSRCSVGSKASVRSVNRTRIRKRRGQNSPGRMIMRPTLLNHMKTHMATEQESEFTNTESESASSSSWATQQTSETDTTDYHPSSPSHQESQPTTGSDVSSRYGSSSISSKAFRFSHRKKGSKKAIGRFKRLRNKLGLIFHHHHHHHHHNSHNNFMWKQLRKIFHGTDKKRVTSKGGHETPKKTAIRSVSRKNQDGKFQVLAEGLRSHVWKSKAMKRKELRKPSLGKKGVKKLHWWRMFRRHRGVKLPNKGRVKIGYVNRKPQLKIV